MVSKWERYAPLSGVLAVILWVVGFLIIGETKDKPLEILAQVRSDDDKWIIGAILFMIGCGLFLWFLGSLRSRLLAAEGLPGRVSAIAYAGAVATATCLTLLPCPLLAAAINKDDLDPSAASAMVNLGDAFFVAAEYLAPVLLVAVAVVALRQGAFPKWFAWLSLLISVGLLIAPIGWAFLIIGVPLWTLIASILVWQAAPQPVPPGEPATGATG